MHSLSANVGLGRTRIKGRFAPDKFLKRIVFGLNVQKLQPYLLATAFVLVALAIRWELTPFIGRAAPFMFFVLATAVTAWFGGIVAGVMAMIAGELLGDYFFLQPERTFGPGTALEWIYLVIYFTVSGTLLWIIAIIHRTGRLAERATLLAESRAALLRTGMQELRSAEGKILQLETLLEERVRERTAALEAANRDLEAFSYSVCHDLRAPLRSINGFTKTVLDDYGTRLDQRAADYLQHVYDSSERMAELIGDLLTLSRVSKGELHYEAVNLSQLAEAIIHDLRTNEADRMVEIRIDPNLVTWGDQGLLNIALENLLRNAWKFTGKTNAPRIELRGEQRNGTALYFVRDNGAGFEAGQAKRLFGVFQRLHSARDFPGTGVGLATVQRILQRHGGAVWGEGKPNEGATFYFTLPARQPAPMDASTAPVGCSQPGRT